MDRCRRAGEKLGLHSGGKAPGSLRGRFSGRACSRTRGWTTVRCRWGPAADREWRRSRGGGERGCWARVGLRDPLQRGSQLCPRDPCSVSENVILSGGAGVFCRRTSRDSSGQPYHLSGCQQCSWWRPHFLCVVASRGPPRGLRTPGLPPPAPPGSRGSPTFHSASPHRPSQAAPQAEPSSECVQAQSGGPASPLLAKCISAFQLCDPGLRLSVCYMDLLKIPSPWGCSK